MKFAGILLLVTVFLVGCSNVSEEMDRAMDLRKKMLVSECSFSAEVTADYGDTLFSYSVQCQSDSLGTVWFEITAPESVAGIRGKMAAEGGQILFDDTALCFPYLAEGQLSPISASWVLIKTLRSGYLTAVCSEDDRLLMTIDDSYEEGALTLDIWLDQSDLPDRADILYKGRRILSIQLHNFSFACT